MTRLTAHIRDGIIAKAVETSGINERNRALVESRALLAEKIRQICLTAEGVTDADLRKQLATIKKYDNLFVTYIARRNTSPYFYVNLRGQHVRLQMDGSEGGKTHLTEAYLEGQKDPNKVIFLPDGRPDIADAALLDEFMELEQLQDTVDSEAVTLLASVKAALSKFTTVEKLLENWPEAKELLPEAEAKAAGTGLALDKDALNALCGIPQPK